MGLRNIVRLDIRKKCPWCASKNFDILSQINYKSPQIKKYLYEIYHTQGVYEEEYLENDTFTLIECGDCKIVYQRDIPNDDFMIRLYSVWIDPKKSYDFYERRKELNYFVMHSEGLSRIFQYIGKIPSEIKVLDYSMGWGFWARLAVAFGAQVYGTEFIQSKREFAQRFGIRVFDEKDLPGKEFDLVNLEQVLEHVPEPAVVFKKLASVVKPGGLISVGVPFGDDIRKRIKRMNWSAGKQSPWSLMPVQPLEHINCFHRAALIRRLHELGFEEVDLNIQPMINRVIKNARRKAGKVKRAIFRQQRPPLTINIVARRKK